MRGNPDWNIKLLIKIFNGGSHDVTVGQTCQTNVVDGQNGLTQAKESNRLIVVWEPTKSVLQTFCFKVCFTFGSISGNYQF